MTRSARCSAALALVALGTAGARVGATDATPSAPQASAPALATASPMAAPPIQAPPTPYASPTPVYHFVYRPTPLPTGYASPAPAVPQIAEIDVNEASLTAPGPIHVRVLTNGVVDTVTVKTLGQAYPIPHAAFGEFLLDAEIPSIPFWMFLHGKTFDISFVAATQEGRQTGVVLPFFLR